MFGKSVGKGSEAVCAKLSTGLPSTEERREQHWKGQQAGQTLQARPSKRHVGSSTYCSMYTSNTSPTVTHRYQATKNSRAK